MSLTTTEISKIIAEILSTRVFLPNVSPDAVLVSEQIPGVQHFNFTIRLGRFKNVLPLSGVLKKIYEETGKKAEGCWFLILGSVVVLDNVLRVHARVVFVETSEIKRAAQGYSNSSLEGLKRASEQCLMNLGLNFVG